MHTAISGKTNIKNSKNKLAFKDQNVKLELKEKVPTNFTPQLTKTVRIFLKISVIIES